MESRLVPVRGNPTMIQGRSMRPFAHLGVLLRPVLEVDAIGQRARQHLGDEEASERRQLGFVLAGTEIDLQGLEVGIAPEVI